MSKRNVLTPVPAKVVRKFAREGRITVTDKALASVMGRDGSGERVRGRLHPEVIAAFNAENGEGLVYAGEKSSAEAKQVTLDLTKPNARGARLKRPEAFPIAEIRARAGVEGKKGRLSRADLTAAAESVMTERGWL